MLKILSATAAVMMFASSALAGATALKSGDCEFQLLDAKGIKPVSEAQLRLITKAGKTVAEGVSNAQGNCSLNVKSGEYLIAVGNKGLAVMSFTEASKLSSCKLLVPAVAPVVIGQGETVVISAGWWAGLTTAAQVALVTTGVVVIGAGGVAVYDNNKSSDDDPAPVESEGEDDVVTVLPPVSG